MTLSAEERAERIIDTIRGRQEAWTWFQDFVSGEIKAAENAKLEEAATIIEAGRQIFEQASTENFSAPMDAQFAKIMGLFAGYAESCATDIRSLKKD